MMELGATVCLPRNPQCLNCPIREFCKTLGEHQTPVRVRMRSQDVAYALALRNTTASVGVKVGLPFVLLKQRSSTETVMPGMWELPELHEADIRESVVRLTVRHAIMQVNYRVRIHIVINEELDRLVGSSEPKKLSDHLRWFPISELDTLPLTGLARKVLLKSRLPELAAAHS
jgi:A/G-specific adenine glycosylase